jgi:vacuolar-type H+-ATPase subunit I/STV1
MVDEGAFNKIASMLKKAKEEGLIGFTDGKGNQISFAEFMKMGVSGAKGGLSKSGAGEGPFNTEESVSEELNEALETIQTLQKELNETNLLNAKLLYVNKVFKANNLNEGQKANVIAAFDKAETVKEVKLVFETVSENIPSGNKKEVVREAKGFASAAVGKSDKPEVITEANEVVLRMQKLAGIIK